MPTNTDMIIFTNFLSKNDNIVFSIIIINMGHNNNAKKNISLSFINNNIIIIIHCQSIFGFMSHNVPAVYDVWAARISKCVAFAGRTKCAGATAWEWSVAE
jgi:hypothetical protein